MASSGVLDKAQSKDKIELPPEFTQDAPNQAAETFKSRASQPIPYNVGDHKSVVMLKHTPQKLAHDIYTHNQKTKSTPVMVMAMAGFGKTTFNRCIIHELHQLDPNYGIYYYQNTDILKLDAILESLPKKKPAILVFDDVSYILEDLPKELRIKILDRLTRVREIIDPDKETPSIIFMDYHYSYALPKTFRQSNFKVYLSVTDEERENYLKQMGYHNRKHISTYIKIFISMMRYSRFYIQNPNDWFNFGKPFVYLTDRPFRPALVSNYGELHLTLFHKVYGCEICSFKKKFDKPDLDFWAQLIAKHGFSRVHKWLRYYTYQVTGNKNLLFREDAKIIDHIRDHHTENKIDLLAMVKLLSEVRHTKLDQEEMNEGASLAEKRKNLLIESLKKMEGREITRIEDLKANSKKGRQKAKDLADSANADAVDIEESEDQDLDKGVFSLAGKWRDAETTDDTDADDIDLNEDME